MSERKHGKAVHQTVPLPVRNRIHTNPALDINNQSSSIIQSPTGTLAQRIEDTGSAALRPVATLDTVEYDSPEDSFDQSSTTQSETPLPFKQCNGTLPHSPPISHTTSYQSVGPPPSPMMVLEGSSSESGIDDFNLPSISPDYPPIRVSEARPLTDEVRAQPDIRDYLTNVHKNGSKAKSHPTGFNLTHLTSWRDAPTKTAVIPETAAHFRSESELIFPNIESFWKYTSSQPREMFQLIRRLMRHQIRLQNNYDYLRVSQAELTTELKKYQDLEVELRDQVTRLQKELDEKVTPFTEQQHQLDEIGQERRRLEEIYSRLCEMSKTQAVQTRSLISQPEPPTEPELPDPRVPINNRDNAVHRPDFPELARPYPQDRQALFHLPHRPRAYDIKGGADNPFKSRANQRANIAEYSNLIPASRSIPNSAESSSQDFLETSEGNWI